MERQTFEEAKKRFAGFGTCEHNPDYFTTFGIPDTDTQMTQCRVCNKVMEKWYGHRSLPKLIMEYLTESKTRTQIYFRFENFSPNTLRGRLSELKNDGKIFSVEADLFTPKKEEQVIA